MFSQYSWWDFIKFVLVLAVPYYAFVLWKYYREDIREWISNRGHAQPPATAPEINDDEESDSSIFTRTDYLKTDEQTTSVPVASRQPQPAEWLPAPSAVTQHSSSRPDTDADELDPQEVELKGPELDNNAEVVFGLPVLQLGDNAGEESVDELRNAAGRLATDEQGNLTPRDAQDKPAARIAEIINQQTNPFDNYAFNR